ncbi:MAG: hypothetical protein IPM57_08530 [Oligoflexia bacterium]|nr:hypothetical protein [Oligoflexia bacterium]
MKSSVRAVLVLLLAAFIAACDPIPGKQLTEQQKIEDMMWLMSRFEEFYAPKEYKERIHKFNFKELRRKYFSLTRETKNNEEFYALMNKYVAEFKDAHVSLTLSASSFAGRARIAYLGVNGVRQGEHYVVTELLPNVSRMHSPLQIGDVVTHIDHVPVLEYIEKNLVPYRNLGNMNSNHTALMGALFTRVSLKFPIPEQTEVELTVKRLTSKTPEQLKMPWIVKDLADFKLDIEKSTKKKSSLKIEVEPGTSISLLDQNGNALTVEDFKKFVEERNNIDNYLYTEISGWTASKEVLKTKAQKTGFELLKAEREVPSSALPVAEAKTYPAYVSAENTPEGKKLVGYVRISDFTKPENSVEELKTTLKKFQELGVKDLVVDTLSNPGGSLLLMMRLAQAFTPEKLSMPGQQFGLSEWWLDNIQKMSLSTTGATQELYKRLYADLKNQFEEGKKISRTYSLEELIPYNLKPNSDLAYKFNIAILVNEMNASCGDIFPMIMQENKAAVIVGTRTMGAGGNVVKFSQAPHSHADISQTLSLIVKKDGSYLENNGVVPDVEFDPNKILENLRASKIEIASRVNAKAKEYLLKTDVKNACNTTLANIKK